MESVKYYSVAGKSAMYETTDGEWVYAADFDRVTAERDALQLLLNNRDDLEDQLATLEQRRYAEQQAREAAERRAEEFETVRASLLGKVTRCKACDSDDLFWYSHIQNHSVVQHNRLNTNDVTCLLILGCNHCSETLMTVKADTIAERMTAALNPTAEAESHAVYRPVLSNSAKKIIDEDIEKNGVPK